MVRARTREQDVEDINLPIDLSIKFFSKKVVRFIFVSQELYSQYITSESPPGISFSCVDILSIVC